MMFYKDDYVSSLNRSLEALIRRTAFFLIMCILDIKPNVVKIYMIFQDCNTINELQLPRTVFLIKASEREE